MKKVHLTGPFQLMQARTHKLLDNPVKSVVLEAKSFIVPAQGQKVL